MHPRSTAARPRSQRWMSITLGTSVAAAGLVGLAAPAQGAPRAVSLSTAYGADAPYWGAAVPVAMDVQGSITDLKPTSDGAVMVAGYFDGYGGAGTVTFPTGPNVDDSIVLRSTVNERNGFVARYDPARSAFDWVTRVSGSQVIPTSIAVTADDSIVVSGTVQGYRYVDPSGTAYFPTGPTADDSVALTTAGWSAMFVAAMNPGETTFAWAKQVGGPDVPSGSYLDSRMAVSGSHDVVVQGTYGSTIYFPSGPASDDSIGLPLRGAYDDLFVAHLDLQSGDFDWARSINTSARPQLGRVVATDDSVFATGSWAGTGWFPTGPGSDDSVVLLSQGPARDMFVGAINADDSYFTWVQQIRNYGTDWVEPRAAAVTSSGRLVISGKLSGAASFPTGPAPDDSIVLTSVGTSRSDAFVAMFNADDSYVDWALLIEGPPSAARYRDVSGEGLAVTADDTVLLSGSFQTSASFPSGPSEDDSIPVPLVGSFDSYVAAISADDSYFSWVQTVQTVVGSIVDATQLSVSSDDSIVAAGSLWGEATFSAGVAPDDSIVLTTMATSGFVAVLGAVPAPSGLSPSPSPGPSPAPSPGPSPSPAPTPTYPPSEPRLATAVGTDEGAAVSWKAPSNEGSFAVTHYDVRTSPAGGACLVMAPQLSCVLTGLDAGTTYTVSVRALNGAGWGDWSASSDEFLPGSSGHGGDPSEAAIVITGTRAPMARRSGVVVTGTSSGLPAGAVLEPMIRFPGQSSYRRGLARITMDDDGGFTWTRRTGKTIYVYVRTVDGAVKSASIRIDRGT